ncbi:MAG: sulfite exporter TauE/SafE family protein [Desulfotalea sp.]
MLTIIAIYCCIGMIAGFLAGLLGIGGGLVIVPMLVYVLELQNVDPEINMHVALGTSMASIMFTSISSFMAHHSRGAVQWLVVRRITFGILVGTLIGSCIATSMSTDFLKCFFGIFLYVVAVQMLTNKKPKGSRELPLNIGMFGVGNVIGCFSSFVGIGGGTLSVPFMTWCNIPVHKAIGTSAAIGLPTAVAGTIGYIYNGYEQTANMPYFLGYINLPALIGISMVSVLTAPLGAKLAHSLPIAKLKKIFAILLFTVGTKMLLAIM